MEDFLGFFFTLGCTHLLSADNFVQLTLLIFFVTFFLVISHNIFALVEVLIIPFHLTCHVQGLLNP